MRKWALLCLTTLLLSPIITHATHIIGGELTYQHLGGNQYQVTLKLFRDCGPGNAGFPATAQIRAWYNQGANFVAINIPFAGSTVVPPQIDSCVVDPGVCVEQAIYTQTATLPQVPGGYHIMYQLCCRNGSVLNVINPLNIGASFYSYLPPDTAVYQPNTPTIWLEDFTLANGTQVDNGPTAWSRTVAAATDWAEVRNNLFEARDTDGEVVWTSQWVNISGFATGVNLSAVLSENGTMEVTDSMSIFYRINNGPEVLFPFNGRHADDFGTVNAYAYCLTGDSIQVICKIKNNANGEQHRLDDVRISECGLPTLFPIGNNSAPTFNTFPPIFLCQSDTFNFNHAATDPDGDSLAYKLCDPYDEYSGGVNTPPAFVGNDPTIPIIPWQTGFNATQPLGPPRLVIDSITGMLTGIPQNVGQYVVGVCVEEWRNDSLINTTRRDFQFNIVFCPPVAQAGIDTTQATLSVCSGNAITFPNHSSPAGAPNFWDFGDPSVTTDTSYQTTPSYTYPDTGRYTVMLVTNYGTACADTVFQDVYVGYVNAGYLHDAPKCENDPVNFTDTSRASNNATINSWNWDFGDSNSSTAQNPSHPYSPGGAYTVKLVVGTDIGCTDSVSYTIQIDSIPTVSAGSNQTICATLAPVGLTGSSSTGAATWTTSGTGTFTPNPNVLNPSYNPSAADTAAGSVWLYISSVNNGACNPTMDSILMTFTPNPYAIAGPNQSVCANNAAVSLGGTVGNCTGGTWITSGTGTFAPNPNVLNPTYNPSNADTTAGTVTLTLITTGNGSCPADSSSLTVTITPAPNVQAGPDQNVCAAQSTVTLAGSVGGPTTTGAWSTSGTGTFSPNNTTLPGTYVPSSADTAAGSVTLVLTSTGNGNCNAVTDTVVLTFIPAPAVTTNNNVTVCANNAAVTLNGTSTTGTGIWSTSGTGTFNPNNTTLNATYLPSSADTAAGSVTITLISTNNGTCPADTQQFTITYTDAPAAFPGANDTVCANNPNYTLTGAVWNATGGTWITSGTGTFSPSPNVLGPTYTPSPADTAAGTVTLSLITTGIGSCLPDTQSMTLVITPSPWVSAGTNIIACLNQPIIPIAGSSSTGSGLWSTSGTGIFVPGPGQLTTGYQPSSADTAAGSVQLVLTTTNVGGCLPVTDTITVTFIPLQTVNAGNDTTMCANNAVLPLSGAVGNGPPTGKWSTSGSGTFSPHDSTMTASYIPSNGDTTAGGYTIYLTSTGGCFPVVDSIVVTLTPAPWVNAGPDQILCNNNPNAALSGSVGGGSTTGTWSTPNGTGTFTPGANQLNTNYIPTPADTTAGFVTIVLTSTNNGKCLPVTDTLTLTFITQPTALAGPDQTVCANDTVNLNGSVINGSGTGIWSTLGSGSFIPSATTPNAGYVMSNADTTAGTVTLVWTSTNNGNCLAVTDTMTITITPAPVANAGNDTSVCANNPNTQLNGAFRNAGGGQWVSLGTGTFTPHDSTMNPIYIPSSADTAAGFVDIVLRTTNNGTCNPSTDTMRITFTLAPRVNAGQDIYICQGTMTAPLNGSVTGGASTGTWTTLGSGTFTPNPNTLGGTYNLSTADTTAGIVTLVLTSTNNGGCLPVTDTVQVIITTLPSISAGNDTAVCATIDSLQLNGLVTGGSGIGAWTTTGTGAFFPNDTMNNPVYVPSSADTAAGSVKLYFRPIQSCGAVVDSITVTFQSAPAVFAGTNFNICDGDVINLNGQMFAGVGNKWLTTGTGSFNPHDSSLVTQYTPSAGDIGAGFVEFVLQTGGLALCPGATDTIRINIGSIPVADFWTSPVCQGQTIQLIDTSTSGNGQINFWQYIIGTDTMTAEDTTYLVGTSGNINILHIVRTQFGCTDTITKTLTINPNPTSSFTWVAFCDDSVQFTDQSSGNIVNWTWSFGDSTGSAIQSPGHTYPGDSSWYYATLTVTTDSGCVNTLGDTVIIPPGPTADYIPKGGNYQVDVPIGFTDQSIGANTWAWDFNDGNNSGQQNPTHTYGQGGDYRVVLTVTDTNGCSDSVSYLFTIPDEGGPVAVPSGFTPNGDGENDILYVRGGPIFDMTFTVYNEWGNRIFRTTDPNVGWNGKYRGQPQPNGTYVYTVTGTLKNGDPVDMVGETNILR